MIKYIKIAFKNLNRQKKRSILLGSAIAFGIIAITLLNGFTDGLIESVEDNISMFFAGHIFISGKIRTETGKTVSIITDDDILTEKLIEAGIDPESISRRTAFTGTLIFGKNTALQRIEGVDWESEKDFLDKLYIVEGDPSAVKNRNSIVITAPIAEKLGVQAGESVLVKLETVTEQYNVGEFIVAAITVDPGIIGSINAYAEISYVNELVNIKPDEYQKLSIYIDDSKTTSLIADTVYNKLQENLNMFERNTSGLTETGMGGMPGSMGGFFSDNSQDVIWDGTKYLLVTIDEMMEPLKDIVEILNSVGLIVLIILILITVVGIINTFRMVMLERLKEIGTIRALGMQKSGVLKLFMFEAVLLCILGIIIGFAVSGIIMFAVSLIEVEVSSPFYMFMKNGHPYFKIFLSKIVFNSMIVIVLSLIAAVIPAKKASELKPVDALRGQYA